MTQEEKQLLLRDLCARSLYGVRIQHFVSDADDHKYYLENVSKCGRIYLHYRENMDDGCWTAGTEIMDIQKDKPYLRSMSSMAKMWGGLTEEEIENPWSLFDSPLDALDYFLKNHIDFRGLIPMGLALEAPEDMYKTE